METYYEYIVAIVSYDGEWKIKHFHSYSRSERDFLIDLFQENSSVRSVRVLDIIPHSKMKP